MTEEEWDWKEEDIEKNDWNIDCIERKREREKIRKKERQGQRQTDESNYSEWIIW
jgi:hypothetical protein